MPSVTARDVKSFAHHVLVDREHQLVFFTIPKVACTEWIKLFVRMQGADDWGHHPHVRPDRPFLSRLPLSDVEQILNDDRWFTAVFFRDPVERMLSAYLDKLVFRQSYQIELFGDRRDVTIDEFLEFVLDDNQDVGNPRGLHAGSNPHWRPQSLVAGIEKFVDGFDFVGDHGRLADHGRVLLEHRGLWERFGATGWGTNGAGAFCETNDSRHRTGAQHKLSDYLSPEQFDAVRRAYSRDDAMFARVRPDQQPDAFRTEPAP